jgi:hypothetical protein
MWLFVEGQFAAFPETLRRTRYEDYYWQLLEPRCGVVMQLVRVWLFCGGTPAAPQRFGLPVACAARGWGPAVQRAHARSAAAVRATGRLRGARLGANPQHPRQGRCPLEPRCDVVVQPRAGAHASGQPAMPAARRWCGWGCSAEARPQRFERCRAVV